MPAADRREVQAESCRLIADRSYYIWTIGCQMNRADSRRAASELEGLGYREAARPEEADLILLNSCVVRQSAEDKVVGRLSSLRSLKARRPQAAVVLMGCLVGDVQALAQRFPYVDLFLRPSDVAGLVSWVERAALSPGEGRPSPLRPGGERVRVRGILAPRRTLRPLARPRRGRGLSSQEAFPPHPALSLRERGVQLPSPPRERLGRGRSPPR